MRVQRTVLTNLRLTLSTRALPHTSTFPRHFSTTRPSALQNRIYDSVRNVNDLQTLLLLSTSSRQPLITLWTASWAPSSPSCATLLNSLISTEKIGESATPGLDGKATSIGFAEIEADAPDMIAEDVAGRYMVNAVPMLLAFSRGEAQVETRVTDIRLLRDREFLIGWLEKEAQRGGQGGAGGNLFGGWFKGWGGGSGGS